MREAGQSLDEELFESAKDIIHERASKCRLAYGKPVEDFSEALEMAKTQYRGDIIRRFWNPSVADQIERLLMDSSKGELKRIKTVLAAGFRV